MSNTRLSAPLSARSLLPKEFQPKILHFVTYDVPGAVSTNLLGINEPGEFTGGFDPDGSGIFQAFVSLGGTITSFSVPEAASTFAYEINDSKQLVVA